MLPIGQKKKKKKTFVATYQFLLYFYEYLSIEISTTENSKNTAVSKVVSLYVRTHSTHEREPEQKGN